MIKRQLDLGGSSEEAVTPGKRRTRQKATKPPVTTPRASKTSNAKKAALGFCALVYPTRQEAADVFGLPKQNLTYWIRQYSQRDPAELKLLFEDANCSTNTHTHTHTINSIVSMVTPDPFRHAVDHW